MADIEKTLVVKAQNGKYLIDCTLYVTLEPCVMCAGALRWSQLDRVVYGATDSKRGFQQAAFTLHPKTKVNGGLMAEEAKALLDTFFAKKEIKKAFHL